MQKGTSAFGLEGDYAVIKRALNETLDALQRYIGEIGIVLDEMAERKNLDVEITSDFSGDFDAIKDDVNNFAKQLNSLFSEINSAAGQVAVGSQQVSEASQNLAQGAAEAASSLEEIA